MEQLRNFYHEVRDKYGYSIWENSDGVLDAYREIAPGKGAEYSVLEEICRAGVLPLMANSLKQSPQEQRTALEDAVGILKKNSFIPEEVFREACMDFYAANGVPENKPTEGSNGTSHDTGAAINKKQALNVAHSGCAEGTLIQEGQHLSKTNDSNSRATGQKRQSPSAMNRNTFQSSVNQIPAKQEPAYRSSMENRVPPKQDRAHDPYHPEINTATVPSAMPQTASKVTTLDGFFGPVALFFKSAFYYILFFFLVGISMSIIHTDNDNAVVIIEGIIYCALAFAIWSGMTKKAKITKPSFCLPAGMFGAGTFLIVISLLGLVLNLGVFKDAEELGRFDINGTTFLLLVPGIIMSFIYALAMKKALLNKKVSK